VSHVDFVAIRRQADGVATAVGQGSRRAGRSSPPHTHTHASRRVNDPLSALFTHAATTSLLALNA